jgi:hypothetical protein
LGGLGAAAVGAGSGGQEGGKAEAVPARCGGQGRGRARVVRRPRRAATRRAAGCSRRVRARPGVQRRTPRTQTPPTRPETAGRAYRVSAPLVIRGVRRGRGCGGALPGRAARRALPRTHRFGHRQPRRGARGEARPTPGSHSTWSERGRRCSSGEWQALAGSGHSLDHAVVVSCARRYVPPARSNRANKDEEKQLPPNHRSQRGIVSWNLDLGSPDPAPYHICTCIIWRVRFPTRPYGASALSETRAGHSLWQEVRGGARDARLPPPDGWQLQGTLEARRFWVAGAPRRLVSRVSSTAQTVQRVLRGERRGPACNSDRGPGPTQSERSHEMSGSALATPGCMRAAFGAPALSSRRCIRPRPGTPECPPVCRCLCVTGRLGLRRGARARARALQESLREENQRLSEQLTAANEQVAGPAAARCPRPRARRAHSRA